jgi:aminoglycoside phosphotransferase family enzyme
MEKVIRRVSFEEAERLNFEFWAGKTIQQKMEALTRLRTSYHGGQRLVKVINRVRNDR